MYTTTSITTPSRVVAYILLCSQMLTNCFHFDTPGKEEISARKARLHYSAIEEVESGTLPTNFLITRQLNQVTSCQKIDKAWQAALVQEGQKDQILPMVCKIAYGLANVDNAGASEQQQQVQLINDPKSGAKKKQEKNYDFPGGEKIPQAIQLDNNKTIKVEFGYSEDGISADHAVNSTLIAAFKDSLNMVSQSCDFHTIYISTTTNGHDESQVSNHKIDNGALAIDISRIDGKPIEALGANHPWVIAFQHAMDKLPNIKENFGPCWLHKEGVTYSPKPACRKQELCEQHKNHIHFSIKK